MREISSHLGVCALVTVVAFIGPTLAGSLKILDKSDPIDIGSIASAMCDDKLSRDRQISRLSTVNKLAQYFKDEVTGKDHKLADCKQRSQDALNLLNDVLATSNENVCSEEKLNLIEDFHNLYVSTHLAQEQSRKQEQRDMAPQLLRLFFMHYAMEVDARCKRTLINNLEWDLKEKFGDEIEQQLFELDREGGHDRSVFGSLFKGAMQKFTDLCSLEKYEDVLMIWDLIENSYLNQKLAAADSDIREEFDPVTGEPVRLLVQVKSRAYLDQIKAHCHYNFKPIYKKLIVPIIKLADLGYSNNGEQFKVELEELRSNEQVRRWYSVTQLCEAMLPVKFYEDPSLAANDVVMLSKKEGAELDKKEASSQPTGEEVRQPLKYEPDTNSFIGIDRLESVNSAEAQKLVSSIKLNLSTRQRIIGRAIVKVFHNIKSALKSSQVGRFFFTKETEQLEHPKSGEKRTQFEHVEVNKQLKKSFDQLSDEELLNLPGSAATERVVKATRNSKGIGQRRKIRRKGDVDLIMEQRTQALSYKRTQSWSEIFSSWGEVLKTLTPSRTHLIIVGGAIIGLLMIFFGTFVFTSFMGGFG